MRRCACLFLFLLGLPAHAEERALCADRPGLGTPACTVAPGRVQVEVGAIDWTHTREADVRADTILFGDTLARIGVGEATELRLGWTMLGHEREKDSGRVTRATRVGDVTLGLKRNLRNPDGHGLSLAVLPYATLPVGWRPIGDTTWSAGLLVPLTYEVGSLQLQLTPEIDAAADEERRGRHLAYGAVAGVSVEMSDRLSGEIELREMRDRDPSGHITQALAGMSLAYQPQSRVQLDVGANAGLNHNSPDVQLYMGVTRRF